MSVWRVKKRSNLRGLCESHSQERRFPRKENPSTSQETVGGGGCASGSERNPPPPHGRREAEVSGANERHEAGLPAGWLGSASAPGPVRRSQASRQARWPLCCEGHKGDTRAPTNGIQRRGARKRSAPCTLSCCNAGLGPVCRERVLRRGRRVLAVRPSGGGGGAHFVRPLPRAASCPPGDLSLPSLLGVAFIQGQPS